MKKILSLVLAAVMVMGMASVAFASVPKAVSFNMVTDAFLYQLHDDGYGEYKGVMSGGKSPIMLQPGKTYFISLVVKDATYTQTSTQLNLPVDIETTLAKKYKVYPEWKQGSVSNITIESRKVQLFDSSTVSTHVATTGYRYVLVIAIPDSTSTKINDLNGILKIGTSSSDAKNNGVAFDLQASYGYETAAEGDYVYKSDTPVMDFADDDTDVDLTWADIAEFSVNVSGQSKLLVKYSTSFDAAFAAKYDYANLDFVKFTAKPSFNRTGVLRIFADEDTYIYEVTADGAKELNATYVGDAWEFKTRTLGAYVISDKELKLEAEAPAPTEPAPTETTKPNPNTGR